MITAWRLVKRSRSEIAFTGEGARIHGGRWNHPGSSVVYLGGSLALVVLELFVHMGKAHANLQFVSFKVEFEDDLVEDLQKVPRNWRQEPPPRQAKDLGTRWAQNAFSPALRVPSVIVPVESNYLLNVQHLDFGKIVIGKPEPFGFDPRMWK